MIIDIKTRYLRDISIDSDDLNPDVQSYSYAYGLRQSINDAGAGEAGANGSSKRLKDLLAGIVPRLGSGGSRLSEVDRATREILTGIYAQWCIPNGTKAAKAGRKGLEAICDTRPGIGEADKLWPKIVAGAERLVKSRKAVLADLGTETRDYIQD